MVIGCYRGVIYECKKVKTTTLQGDPNNPYTEDVNEGYDCQRPIMGLGGDRPAQDCKPNMMSFTTITQKTQQ